jgi:diguanylate cyclase (GGDEF)-like protein
LQLTEALDAAMRRADQYRSRCAFLMIDLDRFKAVNDTLGHLIGDKLLERVAERLGSYVGEAGLCGRLGGDEFAVVLGQGPDSEVIHTVAQRIISGLSQPYVVDHHTLYIGASVGSALGPRDGATVQTLMRNADLALYRAKDEGGGIHFCYEPSLHSEAEARRQLEVALRHALERREFSLAYQPVVDATTGAVLSFEALARWTSAEHGSVSPARFIPVAEDARLIVPIGEWALRTACMEAARWPDPIKIAVNVSGEQLLEAGFCDTVVSALGASGLPPHRLEIEVTESVFLRDGTSALETLNRIIALGCGVALDDFGTGYSSLGYLRRVRFSTIKVDRSFVHGAARANPESLAIVRAVVAMADSLEMSTTAEGVETEEELATVRQLGCRKIQGYLFGRPMPPEAAYELVAPKPKKRPADDDIVKIVRDAVA